MSLLTPLYLLAAAAVSLPILFHLIRRTPRGRRAFSSLMFLSDSPPRLTRRSRLDNLLLLILRGLALSLLACAFARPFLRESVNLTLQDARERRVAIVVDTSASMRRGELWQAATEQVDDLLNSLQPGDDLALMTFDDQVRDAVGFDRNDTRAESAALVRQQLAKSSPGWGATKLGLALAHAADALSVANEMDQSEAALQIVLVSDLQQGAQLNALQSYEWPPNVALSVRRVTAKNPSNATIRVLRDESEALGHEVRVSVKNSADSFADQFHVQWEENDATGEKSNDLAIYVPPGQSRIVRLPIDAETPDSGRIVLRGDNTPFDNTFHTVPLVRQELTVGYLGSDAADDPEGLRYYLRLALADSFRRQVTISDPPLEYSGENKPDLVVVTDTLDQDALSELRSYIEAGGHVLSVVRERESAVQLASFDSEVQISDEPSDPDDYVMLGEIDFSHPLFSVFSKPQYNDFTKIHFWNHVRLDLPEDSSANVLARFDDGSPALWVNRIGEGRQFVITSGWAPSDSQLARSGTKFVPLLAGILDQASGSTSDASPTLVVRDRVALPSEVPSSASVKKPDGSQVELPPDHTWFADTDQPGLYDVQQGSRITSFAINLASAESDTALLDLERLEQLGVNFGTQASQSEELARQRQLRDIELESRQQLWRWLIVAALGVLCLETLIAGRQSKSFGPTGGENID